MTSIFTLCTLRTEVRIHTVIIDCAPISFLDAVGVKTLETVSVATDSLLSIHLSVASTSRHYAINIRILVNEISSCLAQCFSMYRLYWTFTSRMCKWFLLLWSVSYVSSLSLSPSYCIVWSGSPLTALYPSQSTYNYVNVITAILLSLRGKSRPTEMVGVLQEVW